VRQLERELLAHQTGVVVEGCECFCCKSLMSMRTEHRRHAPWRCKPGTHQWLSTGRCRYCAEVRPLRGME
jgi:hypothetical protein